MHILVLMNVVASQEALVPILHQQVKALRLRFVHKIKFWPKCAHNVANFCFREDPIVFSQKCTQIFFHEFKNQIKRLFFSYNLQKLNNIGVTFEPNQGSYFAGVQTFSPNAEWALHFLNSHLQYKRKY
jgi:hypothetical protein